MDDKRFEHIIQSKLKDYETDVPQDLWSKIENELPRKKTVWMKPVYRYAAACAALLIGGFTAFMFLYRPESSNHLAVNKEPISIALPEQQEIPASQQDNDESTEEILWVDNTQAPISPKKQETRSTDKRSIDVQVRTTPEQENKVEAESHTVASPVENKEAQPLLAETPAANRPQSISQEEYERKLKEFESAGQQLQESDYEQILNSKNSDGHGFSIGLMASNSLPGNKNMENRPLTRSAMEINDELNLYSAEEPLKFMHKVPISFGITVEKKLPRNWGLESGVVYTLLRSDYKTASNNRKGKQELHYVGIPLNAIYRFAHIQNASFYAAVGAKADFNVSGRRTENTQNDNKDAKLSEDIRDHRVQWSFHAKAGAAYAFHKMAELYVEPGVSYYVDNSNIPNLWHDRPINFTVQLGLRTNF